MSLQNNQKAQILLYINNWVAILDLFKNSLPNKLNETLTFQKSITSKFSLKRNGTNANISLMMSDTNIHKKITQIKLHSHYKHQQFKT